MAMHQNKHSCLSGKNHHITPENRTGNGERVGNSLTIGEALGNEQGEAAV